eukprot:CAMPEP_0118664062 /NCGR_PEP_ID=MMETSP0785-20121206/17792_1 /TAXON_ID=91992 /ORGANISM="Bolidomonas pacifica, Strain CCMP 1866" /LENGTH=634 /DNA_ID=CAMNT_0006557903 /DNA_START=127 /DNA_END=2029 /DNA_ORIENTATION=-
MPRLDTCKLLNVRTVAVYSTQDANSRHVQLADEAYHIGPSEAKDSYLRGDKVIEAALKSGAKALHPGYGFLSENSDFAKLCEESGVTFMGPPPQAIEDMGSKSNSKEIMLAAGVPCTPGYHGDEQTPEELYERAKEVGYPVLIKAVMGGGGKGMRLVEKESDFISALESCRRESINAFGDDKVLLERYLSNPRHIEVQIVGDNHGNVVHLRERDCSIQRRHQKVLEEAPAPCLSPELAKDMGEKAVLAAKAVGYRGAGTVEFLMEAGTDEFYFCEMNTRLQVEHPVTEMVTGVDLVEWQLRVAAGQELPITDQSQITTSGHAIEARIYAENPSRDFLPATGTLQHLRPPEGPGIRVETGVREGDDVSVFYDPMISKLITYGSDRDDALDKMISALKRYEVTGMPTNIPFVEKCAKHEEFRKGGVTTGFLDIYADDVKVEEGMKSSEESRAMAAVARVTRDREANRSSNAFTDSEGAWRGHGRAMTKLEMEGCDEPVEVWQNRDGTFDVDLGSGKTFENIKVAWDREDKGMEVVIGNKRMEITVVFEEEKEGDLGVSLWNRESGKTLDGENYYEKVVIKSEDVDGAGAGAGGGTVFSPMPGKITAVMKGEGEEVKQGEVVLVLEAMKMEHPIVAG